MTRLPLVPELATGPSPLLAGQDAWQMGFGERAALVGLLSELRPKVAIEIGTAEGGSLRRIAHYSEQVHSFDLLEPDPALRQLANVEFHVGDSHKLLPELLAKLSAEGTAVDFVLVDGDHSAGGVAQDMRDLLDSPAVGNAVLIMHDTMNEEVRGGLESVEYAAWPHVRYVELDFVAGFLFRGVLEGELWGGLGLVVLDASRPRAAGGAARQTRYHDTHPLVVLARARIAEAETASLRARTEAAEREAERLQKGIDVIRSTASWRVTAPLRGVKQRLRRR
jgi:Methyltransferase domain